jgi:glycosyltransferase involved in cell wall biosynthesis
MCPEPKIALVHDWLVTFGGAEQTLAALLEIWPEAPVHTLVFDPKGPCEAIGRGRKIYTSFLQKMPGATRDHRKYLPLMPLAIEQFDLSGYDVVISSSHAVAKGVLTRSDQPHISYIHTPMRYAWQLQADYLKGASTGRTRPAIIPRLVLHYVRLWDLASADRVDWFIANSINVARRIHKVYRREAQVIYPPIDVERFEVQERKEAFYIAVARLVPHKKIDLLLEAFGRMPEKVLAVFGDGPELKRLRGRAGKNVTFMGFQPFETLKDYLKRARALISAAEEDFGMVAVEAQACGTPVIAYRKGGALETVFEGKTGIFFDEQSTEHLVEAIQRFESNPGFDAALLRQNAERFSKERFQSEFRLFIETHN